MQRQIVRKPRSLNPSLCCSWRGDGHRVVDAVPDERPVRGAALHAAPAPAAREGSRDVELVEVEPEHDAVSRVTCLTMRQVSPEEGDGGVHAAERVGAHGQLGLRGQVGRVLRGAAAARQPEDAAHAETS